MELLVTGSAGFIGSNYVTRHLAKFNNHSIVSLDQLTYAGNLENLKVVMNNPRHHFVNGDIRDKPLVDNLVSKNPDVIINFAAESHVDRSIDYPEKFLSTNTIGAYTLLEAARKYDIPQFVQISTDEVYGSLSTTDPAFTENTTLSPSSPYSASKAAADLLAISYYKTYNTPVKVTRCSNNYGPNQFPEKIIPLFINNLLNNKPLPIYGTGENVRDWIHVYDHCDAIDAVLLNGRSGQIYNIGGGTEKQNLEVADNLIKVMGSSPSLIKFISDRPGHDLRYAMDCSKIYNELKWTPKIKFESGLIDTIEWYKNNVTWLKNITNGSYRNYYDKMYGDR
ncbi:MAG TPA: dTDP-glucose 4,6-dehydratase [Nitrospinota bacterium]|nr:dTDP-glucose 4,6-dehydratase [Nitrospinota bacterium]